MYYEINTSLNGKHFFSTNKKSINNDTELKKVYKIFKTKFLKSEGYELSVTLWQTNGTFIDMEEILDE